jgi:hypothetical protein
LCVFRVKELWGCGEIIPLWVGEFPISHLALLMQTPYFSRILTVPPQHTDVAQKCKWSLTEPLWKLRKNDIAIFFLVFSALMFFLLVDTLPADKYMEVIMFESIKKWQKLSELIWEFINYTTPTNALTVKFI